MDDRRVGLVLRALRRRRRWRQDDLAATAGASQSAVSRAELGHLDTLSLRQLRALFAAVDARVVVDVRWRGGDIDRLIDEDHTAIALVVADELGRSHWEFLSEVTFMRLGERGSFDTLAVRVVERAAAMFEFKSDVTSWEETKRRFDAKQRVVASVVEERFGWRPRAVGAFLVVSDTSRNRRRIERLGPLVRSSLPAGTRDVRRWLRSPVGSVAGVWFVRFTRGRGGKRSTGGSHRIRCPGHESHGADATNSGAEHPPGG